MQPEQQNNQPQPTAAEPATAAANAAPNQAPPAQQPQPSVPTQPAASAQAQQPTKPPAKQNPNSTQNTLLISELRDNMVVLNDGSFRAVIVCKSINFDLMSSGERESIEFAWPDANAGR